jgi:cyclophilin family peptidyl-prolyl cis-trans isomerase
MDLHTTETGTVNWIIFLVIAFSATIGLTTYSRSITNLYDETLLVSASVQEGTTTTGGVITSPNTKKMTTAVIETSKGSISVELFNDKAPKTVENFIKLADSGFYNGIKFHRVIKDFMVQAGDPQSKDASLKDMWGTGGPGYKFNDEINPSDELYKTGYVRGILAMANSGPNTNGSQFFIMHKDVPLPPAYTIFGKVTAGIETIDAIANVETFMPGQVDRPIVDVTINKITVQK